MTRTNIKNVIIEVDIENIEDANKLISAALKRAILAENALHDIRAILEDEYAELVVGIESILNNHEQDLKEILNG